MNSREFAYWLQGYFELRADASAPIPAAQAESIQRHLALVFRHEIDPSAGPPEHQVALDEIHAGLAKATAMAERAAVQADAAKIQAARAERHGPGPVMRC